MFVADTNILVYAAERSFPQHDRARRAVESWRDGDSPCFVTWGILYEFMRVTTHPRIFAHPWSWREAQSYVAGLLEGPSVDVLQETGKHADVLRQVIR